MTCRIWADIGDQVYDLPDWIDSDHISMFLSARARVVPAISG